MKKIETISLIMLVIPLSLHAQQILTLDDCKALAVENSRTLQQSAIKEEMADYDLKIARANYFPKISATGGYLYNSRNLTLVNDGQSEALRGMGSTLQGQINSFMQQTTAGILSNPQAAMEYMGSPLAQTLMGALSSIDLSGSINEIGAQVDDALHLDIQNVWFGAVTLEQPVFAGGKIVASNRIASLAKELSESQFDSEYSQIILDVDAAYWQIVSISAKKKLAEDYCDLLEQMLHDAEVSAAEGVVTQGDVLSVKVKTNDAKLKKVKATNGLVLAKMLLCKQIGLPLDTDIVLADEGCEEIASPQQVEKLPMEQVYEQRSEVRSLELASRIYEEKVKIARADMMPQVAAVAGYTITNPNAFNGFSNSFNGGMFSAGVMMKIPIFHGTEALQKTRKAEAEARRYRNMYDDSCEKINLQVTQMLNGCNEAQQRMEMAYSCLEGAEENLRTAMVGFREGVVESTVAMGAQTAWLEAHGEYIDACVELQMATERLKAAQGMIKSK